MLKARTNRSIKLRVRAGLQPFFGGIAVADAAAASISAAAAATAQVILIAEFYVRIVGGSLAPEMRSAYLSGKKMLAGRWRVL